MTTARNSITGDLIQTKPSTQAYEDGWEKVFGKKEEGLEKVVPNKYTAEEMKNVDYEGA